MIPVNTINQVAMLVQQFPQLVDDVNQLTAKLRVQTERIKARDGDAAAVQHPGLRALRAELVTSRTTISRITQLIHEGARKARNIGVISQADLDRVTAIGLRGLAGNDAAWTNAAGASLFESGGGKGLGVLPAVAVISWGIAIAIAGSLIVGSFVLAWNDGAESRARAKAISDQNDALIASFDRETRRREEAIDAGILPPDAPMPTLQPPPQVSPSGAGEGIAKAGSFIALALVGVGAFLFLKGRK